MAGNSTHGPKPNPWPENQPMARKPTHCSSVTQHNTDPSFVALWSHGSSVSLHDNREVSFTPRPICRTVGLLWTQKYILLPANWETYAKVILFPLSICTLKSSLAMTSFPLLTTHKETYKERGQPLGHPGCEHSSVGTATASSSFPSAPVG